MSLSAKDKALLFELLPQYTSLGVVSLFLKGLNLSYSAVSWGDMFEKRLEPAIAKGDISRRQLYQLLSDSEEFGHQNVFLFRCSKATASDLVNEDVVKRILKRLDREDLIDSPPIIRTSDDLALSQVRFEIADRGRRALVIKVPLVCGT